MFCSTCGLTIAQDLSYCNHCGTSVGGVKEREAWRELQQSLDNVMWAIVGLTIVGLGVIIGLMAVMKEVLGFSIELIVAFTCVSFLMLIVAEAMFIRLFFQRMSALKKFGDNPRLNETAAKELNEAQARQLTEPAASVTEHTTRNLESVLRQPKSQ